MSDKKTKRGYSLYLEEWFPSAKKYINICRLCGAEGYSPVIEAEGFCGEVQNAVIRRELKKTLPRLPLDAIGRCEMCARAQDKNEEENENERR